MADDLEDLAKNPPHVKPEKNSNVPGMLVAAGMGLVAMALIYHFYLKPRFEELVYDAIHQAKQSYDQEFYPKP